MRDIRHAHNIWDGKPEGRRPLARTMHRREDDIKMDITELECDNVDWIQLAKDREQWQAVVNIRMNLCLL